MYTIPVFVSNNTLPAPSVVSQSGPIRGQAQWNTRRGSVVLSTDYRFVRVSVGLPVLPIAEIFGTD